MLYAFLGLLLLAAIGTGGGYWHGVSVGEQREAAKTAAAEAKLQAKADQLEASALQKQAEIVAAFDKGRSEAQEKTKIVYVKGAQYAATDRALSSPNCVMSTDSLLLLNGARADMSTAAAAVAALGLSEPVADQRPVIRSAVSTESQGRGAVPGVPSQPAQLRGADAVPGVAVPSHPKPTPVR